MNLIDPSGLYFRTLLNLPSFYSDARENRISGHQKYPGEKNSFERHYETSYSLTERYGPTYTRLAGLVNEIQGLVLFDIPNLGSRLRGDSPWAFHIIDIYANEYGIRDAKERGCK